MRAFEFMKTINIFVVLTRGHIICYVHIPPGAVIVDTVPSVVSGAVVRSSVHHIARDILASAEGGEEIGEVVADPFMGV